MSTRIIGAIIMVHGDENGLVIPPKIAPVQVVLIPVQAHKEGVKEKAYEIKERLDKVFRTKIDVSDKMAGWKFSEYEMKGIPIRLEIGPKDIEKNQCVLVRRDTREKVFVSLDNLENDINELLDAMQTNLYNKALKLRDEKTYKTDTFEEFAGIIEETPGFIKAMLCGDESCEDAIKEKTGATSRCIPFEQEVTGDGCICCGKKENLKMVYWGKAY
jgi:prolyl-tRNA synthetase